MSLLQHTPANKSGDLSETYRRAIAEPSLVTRANKNKIIRAPSPDTEDRICRAHCGLSMPQLYEKTLCNPEQLTEIEARLVKEGARLPTRAEIKLDQAAVKAMSPEQRRLLWEAVDAVTAPEDVLIKRRACDKLEEFAKMGSVEVAKPQTEECRIAMETAGARKPIWAEMIENDETVNWGFICFRTGYQDNLAWAEIEFNIQRKIKEAVHKFCGTADIFEKFKIEFIQDKFALADATQQVLKDRFKARVEEESFPSGLRKDCFLSTDDTAFSTKSNLVLSCWEAGFDATKPLPNGYTGALSLPVEQLVFPLYAELLEGRMPLRALYSMARPLNSSAK